ncbi:MAG: hypothetical protein H7257_11050 [Taibaiella sp.]|nr:hypothetical protein [Taibaiella sp.]
MNIINTDIINDTHDVFWEATIPLANLLPRRVLILTEAFANSGPESEQLNSLLKAGCKLKDENVNIVQLRQGQEVAWHKLKSQLAPKVVLLFNLSPAQLGVSALFRLNDINNFDKCYWIPTVSLQNLIQDKAMRGQLWNNCLKPLFDEKLYGDVTLPDQF